MLGTPIWGSLPFFVLVVWGLDLANGDFIVVKQEGHVS